MTIAIIGAGHGGVQAAESLRLEGYAGSILLMEKGAHLPYQRPPLSKDYLKLGGDPSPMPLRGADFYRENDIELMLGAEAVRIDAREHAITVASGERIQYEQLVIASGAEARRPQCEGAELTGINYLRTLDDAESLHDRLERGHGKVVVVGAGFIGLEFAAAAASRGLDITVIDFAVRPMERVLSPSMSAFFSQVHRDSGINLQLGEGLADFIGDRGHVCAVRGTSGTIYPCDFALVGLGVTINDAIVTDTEIFASTGVPVDEYLRTNAPDIYAIGDVAIYPSRRYGKKLRLEAVQNATDMGKAVARTVAGTPTVFDPAPWFWSTQGSTKLQIAGLTNGIDTVVTRGDPASRRFSQFLFNEGRLTAVESVSAPADHVSARRLLDHGWTITPEQAGDPDFDLRKHVAHLITASG